MTRKQSMRTKHTTKSRSTSKRHRSLRKKSGGGWFDSSPANPADDALPWHKKALNFVANIFSSAPPVPQNASPLPRPGQPAQQLQQVQRPVQQQALESTKIGSDDIAQFPPPDAASLPPPDAASLTPPDTTQFGSPTTAFGGRRRRSNKNKNKNKKK